ncbi:hypothetical protein BDZ85DRAFT_60358 [Elsinoe ampelina]|uniref:Uncharacterized protein n=1 Tax=Elsinoe ampelina TaxID=302913 RepID=A0A6A6G090_9PEZI|nr:hypothetical protein BDZ85DRAFT_60358 [Elsinoe ampelina]
MVIRQVSIMMQLQLMKTLLPKRTLIPLSARNGGHTHGSSSNSASSSSSVEPSFLVGSGLSSPTILLLSASDQARYCQRVESRLEVQYIPEQYAQDRLRRARRFSWACQLIRPKRDGCNIPDYYVCGSVAYLLHNSTCLLRGSSSALLNSLQALAHFCLCFTNSGVKA